MRGNTVAMMLSKKLRFRCLWIFDRQIDGHCKYMPIGIEGVADTFFLDVSDLLSFSETSSPDAESIVKCVLKT